MSEVEIRYIEPPKREHSLLTKETGISVALVIAIAAGVYNFAFTQGKNEARDKAMDRMEQRLDTIEKNQKILNDNQIRIETIIKRKGW